MWSPLAVLSTTRTTLDLPLAKGMLEIEHTAAGVIARIALSLFALAVPVGAEAIELRLETTKDGYRSGEQSSCGFLS
jgi:hypothetical protein